MKTVWILNHYAQVPGGPGGTRHYYLAKYLREYGWKACVIAASTEHGTGRQRNRAGTRALESEKDGVRFLWVRAPQYSGSGIGRVVNMAAFAVRAGGSTVTRGIPKPDVVIGSSVHPLSGLAAARISKQFHIPFVFEVRDLWPETLIAFGRISRTGLVAKSLRMVERYLYKRSAAVISVLPRAAEYIAGCGVDPAKVNWISNGVDTSRFDAEPAAESDGVFTFMYLGAHGRANSLVTLINAMSLIEQRGCSRNVCLRLIGEGGEKAGLRELVSARKLSGVRFESAIPASDVPRTSREADAFLVLSQHIPGLYRFGISANKMYDYMAASRPIIAALETPENPVERSRCGLVVPPEQPPALADAMIKLVSMPLEKRRDMGLAGRRYAEEHYDYRILSARLANLLNSLVQEDVPALR